LRSVTGFFPRKTSIWVFPERLLCGTLFFVYALHADALSHKDLGRPGLIIAVRFMVNIVQLARSAMVFVSLSWGIVSLRVIPLCFNSAASSLLRNSPPQSA